MLTVVRYGISSQFDTSPWPDGTPLLYQPFLNGRFYEQAFLDYIRKLRLPGIYIDAGSCLGTHTVWFALYCQSAHVHAFDPRERFATWTQMNVDSNNLGRKVTVHCLGLASEAGEASSRLDGVVETFKVERLDRVVRSRLFGHRVSVLKIDVEGMEALVLRGSDRILRRDRPVVFAEALTEVEFAAVEAVLAPYGYRATGRVFNTTPTYEFVAAPTLRQRARRLARRLPTPVRRSLRNTYNMIRGR